MYLCSVFALYVLTYVFSALFFPGPSEGSVDPLVQFILVFFYINRVKVQNITQGGGGIGAVGSVKFWLGVCRHN